MTAFLAKRPDLQNDGLRQRDSGAVFGVQRGAAQIGGGVKHVGAGQIEQIDVVEVGVLSEQRDNVAVLCGGHDGGVL